MSDQKIEIEISTKATGTGAQQAIADIQNLKAETNSAVQEIQDSAVPALADYTKSTETLGEASENARASQQRLNDVIAALPVLFKTLNDAVPASPAEKWEPSQINAVADALERIAVASQAAAENTGKLQVNLEAAAKQYALLNQFSPEGTQALDSNGRSSLATQRQAIVPAPMLNDRDFGGSSEVRAAIERAQAETAAVGKAWADGMAQLRAYVESQTNAISARQQNKVQ